MRVAVIGYPLLAERQWNLLSEFEKQGINTHLVVPHSWPSIPVEDHPKEDAAFTVHKQQTILKGHIMWYVLPTLPKVLREINPDVVLTQGEPWSAITLYTEICCSVLNKPHVVFTWENLKRVPKRRVQRFFEKCALSRIDGIVAGSDAAKDRLSSRGYDGPLTVAPQTGVDVESFVPKTPDSSEYEAFGLSPGAPTVLYAGRLSSEKGLDTLFDAVSEIVAEIPDAQFLLVGDGPMAEHLERRVADEDLEAVTLVTEKQTYDRMAEIYSFASIFVYPSETTENWAEQFGYAVAEAMSCGLPVVTTECGSLPSVVGDAGIVCPEAHPTELAESVVGLLEQPETRQELGEAARERVKREFGLENLASKYIRFLQTFN